MNTVHLIAQNLVQNVPRLALLVLGSTLVATLVVQLHGMLSIMGSFLQLGSDIDLCFCVHVLYVRCLVDKGKCASWFETKKQ